MFLHTLDNMRDNARLSNKGVDSGTLQEAEQHVLKCVNRAYREEQGDSEKGPSQQFASALRALETVTDN